MGLIDGYVDRVISKTKSSIGQCGPVSASYNATVDALCKAQRITFEFGGLFLTLTRSLGGFLPMTTRRRAKAGSGPWALSQTTVDKTPTNQNATWVRVLG